MSTENENRPEPTSRRHQAGVQRWRIPLATVTSWTAALPDEDRSLILWLFDYAAGRDLNNQQLGARLKQGSGKSYSGDSVYQAMTGRRTPEQLALFLASARELQTIEREKEKITRIGFVETNLTRKVFQIADATRNFGKVGYIIGESHTGKTTALQEYTARNNHGMTRYIRMVSGGAKSTFLRRFAAEMKLPTRGNDYVIGDRIIACFDARMLLIVDEAQQCLARKTGIHTLEWLRELHDISRCGLLFAATPVFAEAFDAPETTKILRQLGMRKLIHAKLPGQPTAADLADFARHFHLPPATGEARDLQDHIIAHDSLGRWVSILEGASRIAHESGEPLEWDHVISANASLEDLEAGA